MGRTGRLVLGYALWLTSAALSLWAALWLRTVLVADVPMGLLRVNKWSLGLWNYVGSAVAGFAWLAFIVATEGYFRKTSEKTPSLLFKRAARVLAAEAGG